MIELFGTILLGCACILVGGKIVESVYYTWKEIELEEEELRARR